MSRYGARNGAPAARRGMRGRNDGSIRLARKMAQGHGHHLKIGKIRNNSESIEVYTAWCACGRSVVVRDGEGPVGTALRESCDLP